MPTNQARLPSMPQVLLVLAVFLIIMCSSLVWFDLPIQLALIVMWFVLFALGLYLGHDYQALQQGLIDGIHRGMEAVLILVVVGALIGSWIAGGVVPSIIYYGLVVMNPSIFLLAAFLICIVTSLCTGTSFGTVGTAGIAMMGIGQSFGIPPAMVAGAVISGAYVGDKMSPLSDTTVMTASLCEVELIEHVKSMLYVSAPAAAIAASLFLVTGFFYLDPGASTQRVALDMQALQSHFTISPFLILPAAVVIFLLARRKPAIPVIAFGAVLGICCAIWMQGTPLLDAIRTSYFGSHIESEVGFINQLLNRGGIASMYSVIALILFALGLGGLMQATGLLKVISDTFLRWADNPGKLTSSTLLGGIFGNVFGGAAYVSLITASTITRKNYDDQGIDRRVLSRNTEAGGTVVTPMVPWTDGGVFMAATLGVSTISYLPFLWYNFLVLLITLMFGTLNVKVWRTKN